MNKESIPCYHASQCCRTCKYRTERMYMICGDTEWQEICTKYNCDIHDFAVCDSFECWSPEDE